MLHTCTAKASFQAPQWNWWKCHTECANSRTFQIQTCSARSKPTCFQTQGMPAWVAISATIGMRVRPSNHHVHQDRAWASLANFPHHKTFALSSRAAPNNPTGGFEELSLSRNWFLLNEFSCAVSQFQLFFNWHCWSHTKQMNLHAIATLQATSSSNSC